MSNQTTGPIFPSNDPDDEPTDANPVPLSPTDPKRRTSEGDTAPNDHGGVRAVVAPLSQTGSGSGVGGAGTPAIPVRTNVEPPVEDGEIRPDSEGAV